MKELRCKPFRAASGLTMSTLKGFGKAARILAAISDAPWMYADPGCLPVRTRNLKLALTQHSLNRRSTCSPIALPLFHALTPTRLGPTHPLCKLEGFCEGADRRPNGIETPGGPYWRAGD